MLSANPQIRYRKIMVKKWDTVYFFVRFIVPIETYGYPPAYFFLFMLVAV